MSTHNIHFRGEIRKLFTGYSPLSRPIPSVQSDLDILCLWTYSTVSIDSVNGQQRP